MPPEGGQHELVSALVNDPLALVDAREGVASSAEQADAVGTFIVDHEKSAATSQLATSTPSRRLDGGRAERERAIGALVRSSAGTQHRSARPATGSLFLSRARFRARRS